GTFNTQTSGLGEEVSNITVTPTANGCPGTPTSFTITINPTPLISVTNFPTSACGVADGSFMLTGLSANTTYTVNYNPGGPATATTDGTGALTISDLAVGPYTGISVETPEGCMSDNTVTANILNPSGPATPVLAAEANPICEGDMLTINVVSPAAGVTYDWNLPGGGTYLNDTTYVVSSTVIGTDNGSYTVTATEDGCTATSNVLNITINPVPAITAEAAVSVCEGEFIQLGSSASATGGTFSWTGPDGFSSSDEDPLIAGSTLTASGTYSVTVTLNGCTSSAATQ